MKTADYWISNLSLKPHPEGGYYKEIYHSDETVPEKAQEIYFSVPEWDRKILLFERNVFLK